MSAVLLGLTLAACVTKQDACGPSCAGCCDSTGICLAGSAHDACGSGGAACQSCILQHSSCQAQTCVLAPDGGGAGGGGGTTGGGGGTTGGGGGTTGGGGGATGGGGGATGGGGGGAIDAGPSTYADGGTRYRYWDGGSCAVETDCPCFSSDDCGPGFYCHSKDSTGTNVFCVPGARGVGLAGDTCAGEADCASALCTDSASTGMRCSALCDVAAECPPSLPRCTYIGFGVDRSICGP